MRRLIVGGAMIAIGCGDATSGTDGIIEPPPRSGSLAVEGTVVDSAGAPVQEVRVVLMRMLYGEPFRQIGACRGWVLRADTLGTDSEGRFIKLLIGGGPTMTFCLAVEATPREASGLQPALVGLPNVVTPGYHDVGLNPPRDTLRLWIALRAR